MANIRANRITTFRPAQRHALRSSPGDELASPFRAAQYDKITASDETGQGGQKTEVLADRDLTIARPAPPEIQG